MLKVLKPSQSDLSAQAIGPHAREPLTAASAKPGLKQSPQRKNAANVHIARFKGKSECQFLGFLDFSFPLDGGCKKRWKCGERRLFDRSVSLENHVL